MSTIQKFVMETFIVNSLERRVNNIEKKLNNLRSNKGQLRKFPDGKGGFIEMPENLTLADIIARARANKSEEPDSPDAGRKQGLV